MCLIAFAIDADPACPLLIAANRDEFFDRPTAAMHRWILEGQVGVVAGRDQRDGGTWLGVNESGRVAMLTNVRSALPGAGARSRGELATRWLRGDLSVDELASGIDPVAYGGFNLVVGDMHRRVWAWLGNRDPTRPHSEGAVGLRRRMLDPGIYGLSNATIDTPWPKTLRLKTALLHAVGHLSSQEEDDQWLGTLTHALADDTPAAAHELPDTGVPLEIEKALSSPFVKMAERGYGTRSSLVLRARPGALRHRVDLHEWTHTPQGWNLGGHVGHGLTW